MSRKPLMAVDPQEIRLRPRGFGPADYNKPARSVRLEPISVFVYGTLKRGQRNHDRYCHTAVRIEQATVLGRLYALPAGYPMLAIPSQHILAHGTLDPLADARLQQSMAGKLAAEADRAGHAERADHQLRDAWESIEGDIIHLADPAAVVPPLDGLESFRPGAESLYWRVLICPEDQPQTPVWTYVAPNGHLPAGARRIGSRWP